jgi:hypothetical protein
MNTESERHRLWIDGLENDRSLVHPLGRYAKILITIAPAGVKIERASLRSVVESLAKQSAG